MIIKFNLTEHYIEALHRVLLRNEITTVFVLPELSTPQLDPTVAINCFATMDEMFKNNMCS